LQAAEDFVASHERFAEGHALGAVGAHGVVFPELGFGAEETAQDPLAAKERIDLETLLGGEGLEAGAVLILKRGKRGAVLTDDELRLGIEAGFEGVLRGDGLALGRAGAGGLLSVEAVGLNLRQGSQGILSCPR